MFNMTNGNSLMIGWLIKQNPATEYVKEVHFNEVKRKLENKLLCKDVTKKQVSLLTSDKIVLKTKSKNEVDKMFKM